MLPITNEDLIKRWDDIPQSLREDISSDANADFIWKICDNEHIPEEKRYVVSGVAGLILLGFLHPGDFAEELVERLQINRQTADSIANAINERVFVPIKSELDGIYEPPSKFGPLVSGPPRLVEEIKIVPPTSPAMPTAPPTPKTPGAVNEFERLGLSKETAPKEEPPKLLHEEITIKPSPTTSSFRFGAPTPKLSDIKTSGPMAPKPAVIELGNLTPFDAAQGKRPAAPTAPSVEKKISVPPPTINPSAGSGSVRIEPPVIKKVELPPVPPAIKTTEPPAVSRVEPPKNKSEEAYSAEKAPIAKIGSPRWSSGEAGKPLDTTRGKSPDTDQDKTPRIVHYTEFRTPLPGTTEKPGASAPPNVPVAESKPTPTTGGGPVAKEPPAKSELFGMNKAEPLGEFAKLTQHAEPPQTPKPQI